MSEVLVHPFFAAKIYRFFAVIERPDGLYRIESPVDYEAVKPHELLAEMLSSFEELKATVSLSSVGELMLSEMEAALAQR